MGPIDCPETSVRNCHYSLLRKNKFSSVYGIDLVECNTVLIGKLNSTKGVQLPSSGSVQFFNSSGSGAADTR